MKKYMPVIWRREDGVGHYTMGEYSVCRSNYGRKWSVYKRGVLGFTRKFKTLREAKQYAEDKIGVREIEV